MALEYGSEIDGGEDEVVARTQALVKAVTNARRGGEEISGGDGMFARAAWIFPAFPKGGAVQLQIEFPVGVYVVGDEVVGWGPLFAGVGEFGNGVVGAVGMEAGEKILGTKVSHGNR